MKNFDKSFLLNPLTEYVRWLGTKIAYQVKYRRNHLRIGYATKVSNCKFADYNWIGPDVTMNNCKIGRYTYIHSRSIINNCNIGAFCSIGTNVIVAPGKHPTTDFVSTHPSFFSNPPNLLDNFVDHEVFKNFEPVNIGNDVWIGSNVLIVDGVHIGDGAIIAANAVVVADVEPYAIVGGVPAKLLKHRFKTEEVDALLHFKWWNKDIAWIKANVSKFWSINKFVEHLNDTKK